MAYFTINGYDSYSGCDIIVTATLPLKTESGDSVYFTLGSLQTLSVSTHQDKRPVRSLGNINAKDYVMGQRTIAGSLVFAVFDRHFADNIMKSVGVTMADEIPALDLTINFANEYGRMSKMAIYGVKLINEGQVMSINDLYTENTYQFTALGMTPLESEIEGEQKSDQKAKEPKLMYLPDPNIIAGTPAPEPRLSEGAVISSGIKNNQIYSNKEGIILTASVEHPDEGEDTGLVYLTLKPVQYEGNIYISDLLTNSVVAIINVTGADIYTIELPVGYYNGRYMNSVRTRESNIEKIVVSANNKIANTNVSLVDNIYPVIENVTDSTISVSMFNKEYNTIYCYDSGGVEQKMPNDAVIITFSELKKSTMYYIYATANNKISNTIAVKTFDDRTDYYKGFVSYLQSNRGMLQNDFDDVMNKIESLTTKDINNNTYWPYSAIVDGILELDDDLIKQELMLYAALYENSMIEAYNKDNPYKLDINRSDLFNTDLVITNWPSTKYYSRQNGKERLEGIITNEDGFFGRPNKAYALYGVDSDTSSVKHFIPTFTSSGKENLVKYKDVDKYKELDLNYHQSMYPTLDTEELYAITIKENHFSDRDLLEEPYVYEEDGVVFANVDYSNKILLDSYYFLCVSDMYSTLDTIPKRKVSFNRQSKVLNLTEEYIPFDSNNIYHFWIENSQGSIISKTFIFNYKQSIALDSVLDKELLKTLNNKKSYIVNKLKEASLESNRYIENPVIEVERILSDITNTLYSEDVPRKDIDNKLELYALKKGTDSASLNTVLGLLYEITLSNVINNIIINKQNKANIDNNRSAIEIKPGTEISTKIVVKYFDLNAEDVLCKLYNLNTPIKIEKDYMSIYLIEEHTNKITGFVLLKCTNQKCVEHRELGFNVSLNK